MSKMARVCFLLVACLVTLRVQAQVAAISGHIVNQSGVPVPNAIIRVCNAAASTGTPCTPTVPIYSDYGLQTPISNPASADQYGNYTFFVPALPAPNLYVVQYSPDSGITWQFVHNGPVNGAPAIQACNQVGTTAAAQINAAGSLLPSGGGVIDATCYGAATQTIDQQITALSVATKPVRLILNPATPFNVTAAFSPTQIAASVASGVSGATGACIFPVGTGSSIATPGWNQPGGNPDAYWRLQASVKTYDVFCNAAMDGTQESFNIDGLGIVGNQSATMSGALLHLRKVFVSTLISNVVTYLPFGNALVDDAGSDHVFFNDNFNDSSTVGGYPGAVVTINCTGNVSFYGGAIQFPGINNPLFIARGVTPGSSLCPAGTNINSLKFYNVDIELQPASVGTFPGAATDVNPIQLTNPSALVMDNLTVSGNIGEGQQHLIEILSAGSDGHIRGPVEIDNLWYIGYSTWVANGNGSLIHNTEGAPYVSQTMADVYGRQNGSVIGVGKYRWSGNGASQQSFVDYEDVKNFTSITSGDLSLSTVPGLAVRQTANPFSSYSIGWPSIPPPTNGGQLDCFSSSICQWESPGSLVNILNYGVASGGSTQTVTASGSGSSIALSSAADFALGQGVMISHAGAACGTVKSNGCTLPPTPSVSPQGTTGSTIYTYQLACIDGFGGVGAAGSAGSTSTGNATLAGIVSGQAPISGNFNQVTWTGNANCNEVAIYRNAVLIASEYSGPSGTMTFNDVGLTAWTNRDIPSTPPSSALNDNYDGIITAISGTSVTLKTTLGVAITSAVVYHDDAPLMQAAIGVSKFLQIPPGNYLLRYPINYTKVSTGFSNAGYIDGFGANLQCDTGDICIDATGSQNVILAGFALTAGSSSTGLFLSRDSATSSVAQNIVTYSLTLSNGIQSANVFSHQYGGLGLVGIYNYAAEIQHNYDTQFQVDRWMVLSSNNVDHVSSLFSSTGLKSGPQSMSQIDCYSCNGAGYEFGELDDAFTINYLNGYGLGIFADTRHPWGFEVICCNSGRTRIVGMRLEGKQGLLTVAPSGQLNEPELNVDLYRQAPYATTAQIYLNAGAGVNYATLIKSDDYGGAGGPIAAVIDGPSGNCGVSFSHVFIGVQQSVGTCALTGSGNTVDGPGFVGDWAVPPAYGLQGANAATWIKLGTWVATNPAQGAALGISLYGGTGFNTASNDQSKADAIIRIGGTASGTGVPNISGASLISYFATAYTGLKVVATNGSTSPLNLSWDIYIQESAAFAGGEYSIHKAPSDQWINIDLPTSDPGSASSTIFVGNTFMNPNATTATPTGSCTSNGYIPMVIGSTTVHIATCN